MTALARVEAFRRLPNGDPGLMPADGETFRNAMRQLASGVSLITHRGEGQPAGLTATSVTSLSADPPALIVCVNRAASGFVGLTPGAAFGVSVLGADQQEFADRFAGRMGHKGAERFQEGRWLISLSGAPLLKDSLAAFECEVEDLIERHTHAIIIGRVTRVAVRGKGSALIYWRGGYDQLGWGADELARAVGQTPKGSG